jgi:hypothetical protein
VAVDRPDHRLKYGGAAPDSAKPDPSRAPIPPRSRKVRKSQCHVAGSTLVRAVGIARKPAANRRRCLPARIRTSRAPKRGMPITLGRSTWRHVRKLSGSQSTGLWRRPARSRCKPPVSAVGWLTEVFSLPHETTGDERNRVRWRRHPPPNPQTAACTVPSAPTSDAGMRRHPPYTVGTVARRVVGFLGPIAVVAALAVTITACSGPPAATATPPPASAGTATNVAIPTWTASGPCGYLTPQVLYQIVGHAFGPPSGKGRHDTDRGAPGGLQI